MGGDTLYGFVSVVFKEMVSLEQYCGVIQVKLFSTMKINGLLLLLVVAILAPELARTIGPPSSGKPC